MRWWLALLIVLGTGSPCWAQTTRAPEPQSRSYAEQTFLEGQRLFLEKRHEEALPLFEQSYSLQPSPNSKLYIARCLAELGELLAAYETYRQVIVTVSEVERPARYAATQIAASEERAALRQRLAVVRIATSELVPSMALFLSGRPIEQTQLSQDHFADPGSVTLSLSAPGYREFARTFHADGGEVTTVFVLLAPAPPPIQLLPEPPVVERVPLRHPAEDWAWVSAGVGVAGLATWGIFGIQAERRYYRIEAACEAGQCPLDQVAAGRRETAISNAGLVAGLAGFAGAGVLWIWSRESLGTEAPGVDTAGARSLEPRSGSANRRPPRPAVAVGLAPGGVAVSGAF